MAHQCNKEDAIDAIKEDVREIRQDVKMLLQTTAVNKTEIKIKSGIWGAIGGTIPFIVGIIFYMLGIRK